MNSLKKNSKGFTLIELSILIVIAGSIATGILALLSIGNSTKASETTTKRMETIQEAIAAFVDINGYMPCPADRDTATGTVEYGVSTDCTGSSSGTTDVSSGNEEVKIGVIPTRTLNLPDSYSVDGWSNKFTYATPTELAQTIAKFDNYTTTATNCVIQLVDGNSDQILDNTADFPVIAYVLVSHGKDGRGSYTINGPANGKTCGSTSLDSENCDANIVFMDTEMNDMTSVDADVYDDYIAWETRAGIERLGDLYYQ